jgi:uncharacterized ParB-like nuclease family protein
MSSRWVADYNNNKIYEKDGKYYPYWECHYYFNTLEDCKKRIDAKHIAIMTSNFIGLY